MILLMNIFSEEWSIDKLDCAVGDSNSYSIVWAISVRSSKHYSRFWRRRGGKRDIKIVKARTATDPVDRGSVGATSVEELDVVGGARETPSRTKCRVVDRKFDPCTRVWYLNEPFALEKFLWIWVGPSQCIEAATGCSQDTSTAITRGVLGTCASISVQGEALYAGAGVGANGVVADLTAAVCSSRALIHICDVSIDISCETQNFYHAVYICIIYRYAIVWCV